MQFFNKYLMTLLICVFGRVAFAVDIVSPVSTKPSMSTILKPGDDTTTRNPIDKVEVYVPPEILDEVNSVIPNMDKKVSVSLLQFDNETVPFVSGYSASYRGGGNGYKIHSESYNYYTLMSANGENKLYSLGVFVVKNHVTNKECIIRLELRLKRIDSSEYDGETFEGTASWSGPFIDDWKEAAVIGSKQLGRRSETEIPTF